MSDRPPPKILYKYRDDSARTEAIITGRKVWLSTPDQLNDPLECKTGVIPEDWKKRVIHEMEAGQLQGMFGLPGQPLPDTLFSYDVKRTRKWFKRLGRLSHDRKVRAMRDLYSEHGITLSDPRQLFEIFHAQISNVGIFSMSEISENQPMWAHYSGNHTGIALGFKVSDGSRLADQKHTFPVIYDDHKPVFGQGFLHQINISRTPNGELISVSKLSLDDPVLRSTIATKPTSWSYEREWRYIEETNGLFDFPGELASIVFGLRMSEERRSHYRSLLRQVTPQVNLFEVQVSPDGNFVITEAR